MQGAGPARRANRPQRGGFRGRRPLGSAAPNRPSGRAFALHPPSQNHRRNKPHVTAAPRPALPARLPLLPNRRRGRGGAKAPSSPPCHFPRHRGCDPAHCPGGCRRPAHCRRRTGYPKRPKGLRPGRRLSLPAGGHCRPVRGPTLPHPAGGSYRYRGQQGNPRGALLTVGARRAGLGLRSGLPRLPGPGRSRRAPGFPAALPGGK